MVTWSDTYWGGIYLSELRKIFTTEHLEAISLRFPIHFYKILGYSNIRLFYDKYDKCIFSSGKLILCTSVRSNSNTMDVFMQDERYSLFSNVVCSSVSLRH